MPVNSGDIILVSVFGRCFGQRIMLTHHYRASGAGAPTVPTSAGLDAILDVLGPGGDVDLRAAYLACLPPDYEVDFARAQVVWPTRSAFVTSEGWDGNGGNASGTESSNQTGVITLRTENAGRDQISNKHIGPLPSAAQVNGFLSDPYEALLSTLANKLLQAFIVDDIDLTLTPVIYHRNKEPRYNALVGKRINDTVRTQRRRTVGLGE